MKLSELIDKANKALSEVGDVDVVMMTDTPDCLFYIEPEPVAEIVQLPVDEYSDKVGPPVFAIQWPDLCEEDDEGGPSPLTVVK